jgi:hypothetical protein
MVQLQAVIDIVEQDILSLTVLILKLRPKIF